MNNIKSKQYPSNNTAIQQILNDFQLSHNLAKQKQILIKPNLTINFPPPTTTPVALVEEVVKYIRLHSDCPIIIAEGSGGCDTKKAFKELGFTRLASNYKLELIDLNQAPRIEVSDKQALRLKKVKLPEIAFNSYIINLPVLKIHSAAHMTAAMKNLFGFYLNDSFLLRDNNIWNAVRRLGPGWWNKSELHLGNLNHAIIDLNRYIKVNFTLVDASVGQNLNEVKGKPFDPPLGHYVAGYDIVEVDRLCAQILGLNNIKYLE